MYAIARNFQFALRRLAKAPAFGIVVVLTLALGIGATTAVFSLIEGILLRPLPFNHPDRLVLVGDHLGGGAGTTVTAREISTYSSSAGAFSSLGGFISTTFELSGEATPEEIHAARFTAGVFPTLGVQPFLGRVFTQGEEDGHEPVAVISYALWRDRYHHDSHVMGSLIALDRRPYSIVGVMPRDFEFPLEDGHLDQAQIWVPLSLTPDELSDQHAGFWGYQLVARLKDGVTFTQGAQDADRVAHQFMRSLPAGMSPINVRGDVTPLLEYDVGEVRPLLRTLFLAVAVVLLIACANVAGLLLVRAIRKRGESAVRLALGAGSGVIVRESVFEGVLLGTAGGLLGLLFAAIAIRAALYLLPESMPRVSSISLDTTVVAFAFILALTTGAVCSFAPAFVALRTNLTESLKEGLRSNTGGSSHSRLRGALVVSEIAIALVLVTTSAAFLRSFQKMRAVNPGFQPDHVLVAGYQLPAKQYFTNPAAESFNRGVLDRLAAKPAINAVGMTTALPASDINPMSAYTIEGESVEAWKLSFAAFAAVNGEYFRAMKIPLLDGRYFTSDDRSNAPLVVIINQSMAKHRWPGQPAIGKRLHVGSPKKKLPWATIVGIVADTEMGSRDEPTMDQWYTPAEQPATLYGWLPEAKLTEPTAGYIVLRSALPPEQMVQTLRSAVAEVDPLLALQEVEPITEAMANMEAPRRFNTDLITAFAIAGLLLAVVGIYAVIAFSVSQRTQEIAIRMALGAQRGGIARLVVGAGLKLALLGCALGVLGSLAASRLVSAFLFEVSATDPLIYVTSAAIILIMALLASAIPAIRAAAAEPIDALRSS